MWALGYNFSVAVAVGFIPSRKDDQGCVHQVIFDIHCSDHA